MTSEQMKATLEQQTDLTLRAAYHFVSVLDFEDYKASELREALADVVTHGMRPLAEIPREEIIQELGFHFELFDEPTEELQKVLKEVAG